MSGDYELEDTIYLPFTTRQFSDGVPTALVSGVVDIYEDVTATPIVTAETLTVSLNGHAGFNMITCAATSGQGFNAGGSYTAILDAGTVGGVSVIGEVVGHFTLQMGAAAVDLANATDGLTALATDIAAVQSDTDDIQTRIPAALVSGAMDCDVSAMQAGVVTAAAVATDAIDDDAIATGAIASTAFAAGAIDAAAIAAGAIDTDAFTAAAIRQVGGMLVSGTASGAGSSTTLVDTSLTETDDIWTGNWILFTGGTPVIANQCRLITDFDAASDTITFAPDVAAATDATTTFEIYAYGGADVQSWLGLNAAMATPNALVAGAVDADVSAMQAGTITAAAIATDAIDDDAIATGAIASTAFAAGAIDAAAIAANAIGSSELATDAIGDDQIATGAIASTAFAAGAIDAAAIGTGAIDADSIAADAIGASEIANGAIDAATFAAGAIDTTAIATGAIDADALATDAVNEIARAILPQTNQVLSNLEFLMVDSTDHVTPKTGLTIGVTRSIDGGAFGAGTGTAAEVANGIYQYDTSAADVNGTIITFRFTGTAADDTFLTVRMAA